MKDETWFWKNMCRDFKGLESINGCRKLYYCTYILKINSILICLNEITYGM